MGTLIGIVAFTGSLAVLIGWIWIVVIAFREGEILWALGCFFIFPLCIVYGLLNFEETKIPTIIVCAGFVASVGMRLIAFAAA